MADSRLTQSAEQERAARSRTEGHEGPSTTPAAEHPVLRLQRQVGNNLVARMLAQRESESGEAEEEELQAKHDPTLQRAAEEEELQAKHDPALQRAAEEEELQMKRDPAIAQREAEGGEEEDEEVQAKHDPSLAQREGAEEEELQMKRDPDIARAAEEEELQAKHEPEVGLEGGDVSSSLQNRIDAKRGGGAPLADGMRDQMETAMGASFKDVRVHRDAESDAINRSITAKAFTTGNDVFLREDVAANDQSVLAHELTHVVQQRSMSGSGGGMHVGAAGDSYEQEADKVAETVTSGAAQRNAEEEHA